MSGQVSCWWSIFVSLLSPCQRMVGYLKSSLCRSVLWKEHTWRHSSEQQHRRPTKPTNYHPHTSQFRSSPLLLVFLTRSLLVCGVVEQVIHKLNCALHIRKKHYYKFSIICLYGLGIGLLVHTPPVGVRIRFWALRSYSLSRWANVKSWLRLIWWLQLIIGWIVPNPSRPPTVH